MKKLFSAHENYATTALSDDELQALEALANIHQTSKSGAIRLLIQEKMGSDPAKISSVVAAARAKLKEKDKEISELKVIIESLRATNLEAHDARALELQKELELERQWRKQAEYNAEKWLAKLRRKEETLQRVRTARNAAKRELQRHLAFLPKRFNPSRYRTTLGLTASDVRAASPTAFQRTHKALMRAMEYRDMANTLLLENVVLFSRIRQYQKKLGEKPDPIANSPERKAVRWLPILITRGTEARKPRWRNNQRYKRLLAYKTKLENELRHLVAQREAVVKAGNNPALIDKRLAAARKRILPKLDKVRQGMAEVRHTVEMYTDEFNAEVRAERQAYADSIKAAASATSELEVQSAKRKIERLMEKS